MIRLNDNYLHPPVQIRADSYSQLVKGILREFPVELESFQEDKVKVRCWASKEIITEEMFQSGSVSKTLFVLQDHVNPDAWPVEHGECMLRLEDALVTILRQARKLNCMDSGVVSVRCEYKGDDTHAPPGVVVASGVQARTMWYSCVDLLSFPPGGVDPNQRVMQCIAHTWGALSEDLFLIFFEMQNFLLAFHPSDVCREISDEMRLSMLGKEAVAKVMNELRLKSPAEFWAWAEQITCQRLGMCSMMDVQNRTFFEHTAEPGYFERHFPPLLVPRVQRVGTLEESRYCLVEHWLRSNPSFERYLPMVTSLANASPSRQVSPTALNAVALSPTSLSVAELDCTTAAAPASADTSADESTSEPPPCPSASADAATSPAAPTAAQHTATSVYKDLRGQPIKLGALRYMLTAALEPADREKDVALPILEPHAHTYPPDVVERLLRADPETEFDVQAEMEDARNWYRSQLEYYKRVQRDARIVAGAEAEGGVLTVRSVTPSQSSSFSPAYFPQSEAGINVMRFRACTKEELWITLKLIYDLPAETADPGYQDLYVLGHDAVTTAAPAINPTTATRSTSGTTTATRSTSETTTATSSSSSSTSTSTSTTTRRVAGMHATQLSVPEPPASLQVTHPACHVFQYQRGLTYDELLQPEPIKELLQVKNSCLYLVSLDERQKYVLEKERRELSDWLREHHFEQYAPMVSRVADSLPELASVRIADIEPDLREILAGDAPSNPAQQPSREGVVRMLAAARVAAFGDPPLSAHSSSSSSSSSKADALTDRTTSSPSSSTSHSFSPSIDEQHWRLESDLSTAAASPLDRIATIVNEYSGERSDAVAECLSEFSSSSLDGDSTDDELGDALSSDGDPDEAHAPPTRVRMRHRSKSELLGHRRRVAAQHRAKHHPVECTAEPNSALFKKADNALGHWYHWLHRHHNTFVAAAYAQSVCGLNLIHYACFLGRPAAVASLCAESSPAISELGGTLGLSPLALAAVRGHANCCRVLLRFNADVNQPMDSVGQHPGATALYHAALHGRREVVSVLLEHNACVHSLVEADHSAPLTFCRCPRTARLLLEHGAKVSQLITWSENRLWQGGPTSVELFHLYMEHGGKSLINSVSRSQQGDPPLLKLLQGPLRGRELVEAVELLLAYEADTHVRSTADQRTPLQIVCAYPTDEHQVLSLLLSHGADTSGRAGKTPIDLCIQLRKFASLEVFVHSGLTLTPRQRITLRDLQLSEATALLRFETEIQQRKDKQRKQAADENMRQLLAELENEEKHSSHSTKRRGKNRGKSLANAVSTATAATPSSPLLSHTASSASAAAARSSIMPAKGTHGAVDSSGVSRSTVASYTDVTSQRSRTTKRGQQATRSVDSTNTAAETPSSDLRLHSDPHDLLDMELDMAMELELCRALASNPDQLSSESDDTTHSDSDSDDARSESVADAHSDADLGESWEDRAARIIQLLDDQRTLQQQQLAELSTLREIHHNNTLRLQERHKHLDPCFQVSLNELNS